MRLGQGEALADILASSNQVAEGVSTAGVVVSLARTYRVSLPVLTAVAQVGCCPPTWCHLMQMSAITSESKPREPALIILLRMGEAEVQMLDVNVATHIACHPAGLGWRS